MGVPPLDITMMLPVRWKKASTSSSLLEEMLCGRIKWALQRPVAGTTPGTTALGREVELLSRSWEAKFSKHPVFVEQKGMRGRSDSYRKHSPGWGAAGRSNSHKDTRLHQWETKGATQRFQLSICLAPLFWTTKDFPVKGHENVQPLWKRKGVLFS